MEIDVTPIIEKASGVDKALIEMYDMECLYVFNCENGERYSRVMTQKDLDEFVPSKSVSEIITQWEEGIDRRLGVALRAAETGLHPIFKDDVTDDEGNVTGSVPRPLTEDGIINFKREAEDLKEQLGEIKFVKLV